MTTLWYAAHAVFVFELIRGRQNTFTIMENVLLVRASSRADALKLATVIAKRNEGHDPSLTVDGKRARQKFHGIRKLVACAADPFDSSSRDGQVRAVRSGTEATYLTYRVVGRTALRRLLSGKESKVVIEE